MSDEKCNELRHQMGYEVCANCPDAKPMTVEERASKIFPIDPLRPHVGSDLRGLVAEQIQQACDEAMAEVKDEIRTKGMGKYELDQAYGKGYLQGFADAREKAANLMSDGCGYCGNRMSKEIRALTPGEGAGKTA